MPNKIEDEADFVIVGTGAGGATAARVLSEAGYSLAMIEEGAFLKAEDRPRELDAAVALDRLLHRVEEQLEGEVLRAAHEQAREREIGRHERVRVTEQRGEVRDLRAHLAQLLDARALGRDADRFHGHRASQLEQARDDLEPDPMARERELGEMPEQRDVPVLGVVEHAGPRSMDRLHEPFAREPRERRAQRQPADPELLGELPLARQGRPREIFPGQDRRAQLDGCGLDGTGVSGGFVLRHGFFATGSTS
jgi:choline dehydrogenase-like flavoprotein